MIFGGIIRNPHTNSGKSQQKAEILNSKKGK